MQRLLWLLPLALLGCALPDRTPGLMADRRPNAALARKVVADKRPESVLVAHDGTTCTVTAERFRAVQVGDPVWCLWRREGEGVRIATGTDRA